MITLHPRLADQLRTTHADLSTQGELASQESLRGYYATFRQRFGPDVLQQLDGEELLELLKGNGKEDLVYWLEFKDDDEFPDHFGSIAGGSALKYGIYRRKQTRAWTAGNPVEQREISTAEAITFARAHRDQLLRASELLALVPADADDATYAKLQDDLRRAAPDVQDSVWGHKYLSLIHPTTLDDYHVEAYQRFHLIKTLQPPSGVPGRYANAGHFVRLSRELGWPLNHLTTVMNQQQGSPYRYWRIGTRGNNTDESFWPMMRQQGVAAIGWHLLGDLGPSLDSPDFKDTVRARLAQHYPNDASVIGRKTKEIVNFSHDISERDYIVASDGMTVLGIGRVKGPYHFSPGERFPHRRPVEWLFVGDWRLPTTEGLRTTVFELRKYVDNLVGIERQVLEADPPNETVDPPPTPKRDWQEGGVIGRIQDVLTRKAQVILYGPPGTGKTHWAERAAHELAALWNFGAPLATLPPVDAERITGHGAKAFVRLCSFHPGYGYEDFIEGYRPDVLNGSVSFTLKDGIFKALCDTARGDPAHRYYLIVDEINRGDIPRIFGELLTLLEKPKRGTSVTLPVSASTFSVPPNILLIGTMNTADRSIALLDAALRRRFGFVELMPDVGVLGATVISGVPLGPWLSALNELIVTHVGRDGRNLQVGHSYFLNAGRPLQDLKQLSRVLHEDILPLLEEYCYDDWTKLEQILGKRFVDTSKGSFREELFMSGRETELVQAIIAIAPDVSASPIAVAADAEVLVNLAEPDDDGTEPPTDH